MADDRRGDGGPQTGGERGLWLKESTRGNNIGGINRFIHDMDGSSPAVRLMLIVERVLLAPQLSTNSGDAAWLGGDGEDRRGSMVDAARNMDMVDSDDGNDVVGSWTASPDKGRLRSLQQDLFDTVDDDYGRMLDMISFAADNEQWAGMLADTLVSFIGKASRKDGCTDRNGGIIPWDGPRPLGSQGESPIPIRCISAIACMIQSAFGHTHNDDTVSPLSITMSMIVGRRLNAKSALELPMVADGLYGDGRTPMDDLKTILDQAGGRGDDATLTAVWPQTLSLSACIPEHGGPDIAHADRMDDEGMFLLITDPAFPEHADTAMSHAGSTLARIRPMLARTRCKQRPIRIPLLTARMLTAAGEAPARVVRLLDKLDDVEDPLRCDGDLERREPSYPPRHDGMLSADREVLVQRRGMMLASGIAATDWSRCDTEGMMRIIANMSTPRYEATADPMSMLTGEQEKTPAGGYTVDMFIIASLDSGNHRLAADMNALADLLLAVDGTVGVGHGDSPRLWMVGGASALRTVLDEVAAGVPMENVCQTIPMRFEVRDPSMRYARPEGHYDMCRASVDKGDRSHTWCLYINWMK